MRATRPRAPTTTTRASIEPMCTLTIDCRCDTCSDGITRYQWPRIIAVQAPPSIAAEVTKLATVSSLRTAASGPPDTSSACSTMAISPASDGQRRGSPA